MRHFQDGCTIVKEAEIRKPPGGMTSTVKERVREVARNEAMMNDEW